MEYCNVKLTLKAPENQDPSVSFNGKVTFNPDIGRGETWHDNGVLVPSVRVDAAIVNNDLQGPDGKKLVKLMAGGAGVNPEQVYWRIAFDDIYLGEQRVHIDPFVFEAVPGETLDLEKVTPVAGYTPPGIIKGDKGDKGDQGPKGDMGPSGGVTNDGYRTRVADTPASEYPEGISISYQNQGSDNWASLFTEAGLSDSAVYVTVFTIKPYMHSEANSRQIVWGYNEPDLPMVTRSWDLTNDKWGSAKALGGVVEAGGDQAPTAVVDSLPSTPEPGTIYFVTG